MFTPPGGRRVPRPARVGAERDVAAAGSKEDSGPRAPALGPCEAPGDAPRTPTSPSPGRSFAAAPSIETRAVRPAPPQHKSVHPRPRATMDSAAAGSSCYWRLRLRLRLRLRRLKRLKLPLSLLPGQAAAAGRVQDCGARHRGPGLPGALAAHPAVSPPAGPQTVGSGSGRRRWDWRGGGEARARRGRWSVSSYYSTMVWRLGGALAACRGRRAAGGGAAAWLP